MGKLIINKVTCSVVNDNFKKDFSKHELDIINLVAKNLEYRKDGVFFSKAYQEKKWDGYYKKYSKVTHTFQTGLLPRCIGPLVKNGFEIIDKRNVPDYYVDETRPLWQSLRPYQKEAIIKILENRLSGLKFPRGGIQIPPRTGKTYIASALLDQLRDYRPALFIVERIDLARQTVEALEKTLHEEIGIVGDGECNVQPITVVTVQSLHSAFNIKYKKLDKFDKIEKAISNKKGVIKCISTAQIVIVDEYHHTSAPSYQRALKQVHNAFCVVGLSGTPWMDDGSDLQLENAVGPVMFKRGYTYMVNNGYLVPLTIYLYKLPKILCYSNSYQSIYKQANVDNIIKNYIIRRVALSLIREGKSVAILTTQVKHTYDISKMIPGSIAITGKERGEVRKEAYERLHRKKVMCIVSNVINEGIDVPSLDAGINADGGMDSRRIFQRMRMMTPFEGKDRGIYIDFLHKEKHLMKHSNTRKKAYESKPESVFKVVIRDVSKKLKDKFKEEVLIA